MQCGQTCFFVNIITTNQLNKCNGAKKTIFLNLFQSRRNLGNVFGILFSKMGNIQSLLNCMLRSPSRLTCLTQALFSKRLARLFQASSTPYLCALKSFQDGLVVQKELSLVHIFQELLKALQIVLFLCRSKTFHITIIMYIIFPYFHYKLYIFSKD